jgi:hypothetical protein
MSSPEAIALSLPSPAPRILASVPKTLWIGGKVQRHAPSSTRSNGKEAEILKAFAPQNAVIPHASR